MWSCHVAALPSSSAASQCRAPCLLTNRPFVSPLQFANSKRQLPTGETVETGSITVSQVCERATMPAVSKLLHSSYLAVLVAGSACAAGFCSACTCAACLPYELLPIAICLQVLTEPELVQRSEAFEQAVAGGDRDALRSFCQAS